MSELATSFHPGTSLPAYLAPYVETGIEYEWRGRTRVGAPVSAGELTRNISELRKERAVLVSASEFDESEHDRLTAELGQLLKNRNAYDNSNVLLRIWNASDDRRRQQKIAECRDALEAMATAHFAHQRAMARPAVKEQGLSNRLLALDHQLGGLMEAEQSQYALRITAALLDPELRAVIETLAEEAGCTLTQASLPIGRHLFKAEALGVTDLAAYLRNDNQLGLGSRTDSPGSVSLGD